MHPKSIDNFDSTETIDLDSTQIVSYTRHQRYRLRIVSTNLSNSSQIVKLNWHIFFSKMETSLSLL